MKVMTCRYSAFRTRAWVKVYSAEYKFRSFDYFRRGVPFRSFARVVDIHPTAGFCKYLIS